MVWFASRGGKSALRTTLSLATWVPIKELQPLVGLGFAVAMVGVWGEIQLASIVSHYEALVVGRSAGMQHFGGYISPEH